MAARKDGKVSIGAEAPKSLEAPKPGNYHGRIPGSPNKASAERIAKARATGKPMPADTMLYKMHYWMSRVASVQKQVVDGQLKADEAHPIIAAALDKAQEAAEKAAPYYHQRLAAVQHNHQHALDLSQCTDAELDLLERLARRIEGGDDAGDMGGTGETTH